MLFVHNKLFTLQSFEARLMQLDDNFRFTFLIKLKNRDYVTGMFV